MSEQEFTNIITIEPGKRGGKPCIRGMRITVYDVLEYLASGMIYQEIWDDFPYLTQQDILARLSFAAKREQFMLVVQSWSCFCMIKIFLPVLSSVLQIFTHAC